MVVVSCGWRQSSGMVSPGLYGASHLRLPVHGNHVRVGVRMRGHPSGRRAIGVVRVAVRVHVLLQVEWGKLWCRSGTRDVCSSGEEEANAASNRSRSPTGGPPKPPPPPPPPALPMLLLR